MKKITHSLLVFGLTALGFGQNNYQCNDMDGVLIQNYRKEIITSHYLGATPSGSSMRYCPNFFSFEYGASYTLNYIDQGGSGMDAYPNIIIGGAKINGNWESGNQEITGMPVRISDILNGMNLEWKVSQENAWDTNDKWMASINFIFDNYGTETSEPVTADRDCDLVVKADSYNFNGDGLDDYPVPTGTDTNFWFFARESNGDIKPYTVIIDGIAYTYAVRYKFFKNSGDKDNKAHVKFIPYGPNGAPAVLKLNIKEVISTSKNYIAYANLPAEQLALAQNNIALPNAWLKSINAGYEVYTGKSILKIEKFKVNPNQSLDVGFFYPEEEVVFYPNPTSDKITLFFKALENPSVIIYNANGQKVFENTVVKNNAQVDVSHFYSGLYFVRIVDKSKSIELVKKLIVRNKNSL